MLRPWISRTGSADAFPLVGARSRSDWGGWGGTLTTGVMQSVGRRLMPAFRAALRDRPAARRRGLMNSSMPKLSSARPVPSMAMKRPGGPHHHHHPLRTALLANPSRSISPQFHRPGGDDVGEPARPRKAITT